MTQKTIKPDQLELSSSVFLPAGVLVPYGGSSAPSNFLLCDGTLYTTASQAQLFAVIGYAYGGSGANFNVPDMRGNTAVGKSTSGQFNTLGNNPGSETHTLTTGQVPNHSHTASGTANSNGAHTHTLTGSISTVGNHQHPASNSDIESGGGENGTQSWDGTTDWWTGPAGSHTHTLSGASAVSNGAHTHTVSVTVNSTTGGGGSHNIVQPSLVTQYIISTGV